jgi:hypothetical protein
VSAPTHGRRATRILQQLYRLTQADRPHADLSSPRAVTAVFGFLAAVPGGLARAGRILTRLSSHLHCLLPWVLHRHLPFLLLAHHRLAAAWPACPACSGHPGEVGELVTQLHHNLTLLAETGYGEGELCHRLVSPATSAADRLAISISAPLLLRQKKLLRNVLVTHDSLDCLLDFLETPCDGEEEVEDRAALPQAVTSLANLALHLGVAAPRPLGPEDGESCSSPAWTHTDDLTLLLDSGDSLPVNRALLTAASSVFGAMLAGGFSESGRAEVALPQTSLPAITCLVHHLYGCPAPCPAFRTLPLPALLEVVSLSDKFLLSDLNLGVTSCIVRRCLATEGPGELAQVYRLALQKDYPVQGPGGGTLAQAAVALSLLGDMGPGARAALVTGILGSDMRGDYIDDVGKLIRGKLFERP